MGYSFLFLVSVLVNCQFRNFIVFDRWFGSSLAYLLLFALAHSFCFDTTNWFHHHINNNILAMDTRTLMECDNVNGVKLSLKMETGFFSNISTCSPKSRKFTITYKSERNRSSWARTSLFIAVLFNIVVFSYIRISFTAFAYITLIFSFLAFFWVTHSVQSGKKPQYKPCSSY